MASSMSVCSIRYQRTGVKVDAEHGDRRAHSHSSEGGQKPSVSTSRTEPFRLASATPHSPGGGNGLRSSHPTNQRLKSFCNERCALHVRVVSKNFGLTDDAPDVEKS